MTDNIESNYDTGVIIGRFQIHELHDGHKQLIETVLSKHKKVIIFLGTKRILATKRNPLDFLTRKQMLLSAYPMLTVLSISDNRSDHNWSVELDYRINEVVPGDTVLLYGSRDSFIEHYHGKFQVEEIDQKIFISASEIRRTLKNEIINSLEFRAGAIYAALQQYDKTYATVDVAIMQGMELLLARKPGETSYRFVGGFSSPKDENFETTARREVMEETGIEVDGFQYICSQRIDDWRFRNEVDKIITTLFLATFVYGRPIPDDDICELKFFHVDTITEDDLVPEHRILFKKFKEFFKLRKLD